MLTQFRHIQKGTLIVVTVLIVIAFAFLYSDFDFVQGTVGTQDCVVKVYDRCYRLKEGQKLASHYDVAFQLGMYDFATVLFGENRRDDDRTNFMMSLIILRHEAERMGIEPTVEEIKEAIPKLPIFQQPWVTAQIIENNILGPNGFTDGDLAQLVKDYLIFQKLRELIGAGVTAVPSETDLRYVKTNQRYTASLISFDREKYAEGLEISDEDIKNYYEENKETLLSEPKRGFDFVKFSPKTLPEDATNEQKAKSKLAFANAVNRAYADLAEEDADFAGVAKQYEGEKADFVMEMGSFDPFSAVSPPEVLAEDAPLLDTIFSDALQTGDVTVPVATTEGGYYVFYYKDLVEPRPLELDEAKESIRTALTAKNSDRLVNDAAAAARATITEALEGGKSFAEAAKAAKVEPEVLPNFSEREPPAETVDGGLISAAVSGLAEGELSTVTQRPGGEGVFLVYVDKIELYEDENEESAKRSMTASTELAIKRTLFTSWLNQRRAESGAARSQTATPLQ